MALTVSRTGKMDYSAAVRYTRIGVPPELIAALAYQKFMERGGRHGHDWDDWFAAEAELTKLFQSVRWAVEGGTSLPNLTLRAVGPTHVRRTLCRYFQWCPTLASRVGGRLARFRLVWPEASDCESVQNGSTMKSNNVNTATEEQLERLEAARSPVSVLSDEEFKRLRGQLVALLLDGPEKGKTIATAPLDQEHPEKPRRSIREQVAASPYRHRRYQLRQILECESPG